MRNTNDTGSARVIIECGANLVVIAAPRDGIPTQVPSLLKVCRRRLGKLVGVPASRFVLLLAHVSLVWIDSLFINFYKPIREEERKREDRKVKGKDQN